MKDSAKLNRILKSTICFEVTKGHLKWKVSDLARAAQVSRPLIYYHFGKTKIEILESCLELLAKRFYGLDIQSIGEKSPAEFFQQMHASHRFLHSFPELTTFYLKSRSGKSFLRDRFLSFEKRYQKKLQRIFPKLTETDAIAFHSIFHGIVSAPFATSQSTEFAIRSLSTNTLLK